MSFKQALFIWLCIVFVASWSFLRLQQAGAACLQTGTTLVVVPGPLTAGASLVAERGL